MHSGELDPQEFAAVMKVMNPHVEQQEIDRPIRKLDKDRNGVSANQRIQVVNSISVSSDCHVIISTN